MQKSWLGQKMQVSLRIRFQKKKLSVRQAESFVKIFKIKKTKLKDQKDPNIREFENSLSEKIGLNVSIKNNKQNKGTITFSYKEIDQLNKIVDIIKSNYQGRPRLQG